jgi:N-acetyl-beta-hexosaminidase
MCLVRYFSGRGTFTLGGDEAPRDNGKMWSCQANCRKGLKTNTVLQSYFIKELEAHINSKGKIMSWDGSTGADNQMFTVMSWLEEHKLPLLRL